MCKQVVDHSEEWFDEAAEIDASTSGFTLCPDAKKELLRYIVGFWQQHAPNVKFTSVNDYDVTMYSYREDGTPYSRFHVFIQHPNGPEFCP